MKNFSKILAISFISLLILFVVLCIDLFFIEPNILLTKSQKLEIPH